MWSAVHKQSLTVKEMDEDVYGAPEGENVDVWSES